MNIAICDDEEHIRTNLRMLIEKQDVDCRMFEFSSGRELLDYMEETCGESMDILFLDISMQDMDGMEVAKELRNRKLDKQEAVWGSLPLLIFMTGYPQYMSEAFSVHAFGFIVKPVRESDFQEVYTQAVREYRYLSAKKQDVPKEILVRNGNQTRSVKAEDIYYIESNSRKVILCMKQEKLEYYDKISELENELKQSFFRIHKGYLINMHYVERYNRKEVLMKNGDSLLISRYKYQDFVKAYLEYIK